MWGPQLHFDIFIFEYSGAHEEIKTQGFEPLTSSLRSKGNGCCEDLNVQSRLFDHLALICICYVSSLSLLSLFLHFFLKLSVLFYSMLFFSCTLFFILLFTRGRIVSHEV